MTSETVARARRRAGATSRASARDHAGSSLAQVGRRFWRYPSPRVIGATLLVSLALRLGLGAWAWWDLALFAVLVAYHPVNEWLVHRVLLHMRPRQVAGHTFDTLLARKHRAHHADPTDIPLVFIPTRMVFVALAIVVGLALLVLPTWPLRLTGVASMSAIGLVYEWTHYLVHTDYKPRSAWYRYIWRTHRLHHFKNENYWFAFTVPTVDVVLGTWPQPNEVETSPTVRDLHATGEFASS